MGEGRGEKAAGQGWMEAGRGREMGERMMRRSTTARLTVER